LRNFTLGQDGNRYQARLRTTSADANGMPSLTSASGSAVKQLTHLAYTRDASGRAKVYVNGEQKGAASASARSAITSRSTALTDAPVPAHLAEALFLLRRPLTGLESGRAPAIRFPH
jgi:hypothetical protein